MLSASSMIGLPFVDNPSYYIMIYLAPAALLVLIILLNKNYEVFTLSKSLFYVTEVMMLVLVVSFLLTPDPYKAYVLLVGVVMAMIAIVVEMSCLYYSGVDLSRSGKVHPETEDDQVSQAEVKNKDVKNKEVKYK